MNKSSSCITNYLQFSHIVIYLFHFSMFIFVLFYCYDNKET